MSQLPADVSEPIARVGAQLAELTGGRPAASVHAEIMHRLADPDSDPRLRGVSTDSQQFATAWAALADGSDAPAPVWEAVVLPAVIACSNAQTVKVNLELVTSLWLDARAGLDDGETAALPPPGSDSALWAGQPAAVQAGSAVALTRPAEMVTSEDPVPAGPRERRLSRALVVPALVIVALVMVAVGVLWALRDGEAAEGRPPLGEPIATSGPRPSMSATPSAEPSPPMATPSVVTLPAGAPPPMLVTTLPTPVPTWSGLGPAQPPTAPLELSLVDARAHSASLRWQPPAESGTGGLSHYRVLRDGVGIGWTYQGQATISGLEPATSYVFTVVAYNFAGLASAPSAPVTVTTVSPTPPPSPTPPAKPVIRVEPDPVVLGASFTVHGLGWPCTEPAEVELRLSGKLVAVATVDAQGRFTAQIAVEPVDAASAKVDVLDSEQDLALTAGDWRLMAHLPNQPQCAPAANVTLRVTVA